MQLWIIGNGFELAHELKTRYYDFRDYLEEHDSGLKNTLEEGYSDSFELWSNFEDVLGRLDYDDLLEVYRDEFELTDAYGVCAHNMI